LTHLNCCPSLYDSAIVFQEVNLAYDNAKEVDCLDVTKEGNDAWEAAIKRYIHFGCLCNTNMGVFK